MKQLLIALALLVIPCSARAETPEQKRLMDHVRASFDALKAAQEARAKCLADAKCRDPLLLQETCSFVQDHEAQIKAVLSQIAAEKSNPSGVVDLRELNELGRDAQALRNQELVQITSYQQATKKQFSLKQCK